ncbi:hypothetical protein DER46DRAFT_138086 [Fusarium sp. MPI-SDFR-AT-0072]|uniref:Uncharacterized protein n=1 Tax=Fusarium oxysporum f. sp. rapae TaxID=485398 RepID=A0A8J5P3L6_FUSOX|nr:hypothetical protein Forpe1208_v004706 [Fusarium oxysporum f. sp. rapae]KAH7177870.1 hypothetical protein DER46DRAFT_138086 [Fusarium sp. MPI-SDFR-AT-0072]KAI7765647.1 hypothetical protein LZL87_000760 [Fusarium oxysporum]
MGKSLMDKIQAKLELFRLEQRYTRRRHRRSTFVSNAVYVDGEYVYQTPNSTGSSTGSSNIDALHGDKAGVGSMPAPSSVVIDEHHFPSEIQHQQQPPMATAERKRLNRFSSIPHFGGSSNKQMPSIQERRSSMIR